MRLEAAPSAAARCRVCRKKFSRGQVRLQQRTTPFSCLRCVSCQQARNLLREFGSFEAAAAPLPEDWQRAEALRALKAVWRPTRIEERREPVSSRIWSIEGFDPRSGEVSLRNLAGAAVRVRLDPEGERPRVSSLVRSIRESLGAPPRCRDHIVALGACLREEETIPGM